MLTHPPNTHVCVFITIFRTRHFTNVRLLSPAACGNGLITKLLASVAMGISWGEMEVNKGPPVTWGKMGSGSESSSPGRGGPITTGCRLAGSR